MPMDDDATVRLSRPTPSAPPAPVKKDAGNSVGGGVYVMAYFLVIFGIAAGVLFTCRSSGRRERARPEQYGESTSVNPEKK